ncbi:Uncharacterized protein Fot_45757 [Forsythia ovata]|uniref:Inhibitor I9 domain-containing protein n=1 Tax=Forsythia ovata TaxID=205694 RepID=A0ABD1RAL6_9LAMI
MHCWNWVGTTSNSRCDGKIIYTDLNILQVYIVYFGEQSGSKTFQEIEQFYHSYLNPVKGSKEEAKNCLIYCYKSVINGFSALLTPEEATKLSGTCFKYSNNQLA